MTIRNPASPTADGGLFGDQSSTESEGTTTDQSRGGLFGNAGDVGFDLGGIRGPEGPEGPPGMDGANGLSVSRVESQLLPDGSTTRLMFFVGTGSSEEAIPVTVDIPGGSDAADDFSNTVNITTGAPGTDATASLAGTGIPTDPYVLTLMIPRGDVGPGGAHVASASVSDGTLTLNLSDGTNVVVTGDIRGEAGISIVNLYMEQYTSPIGTTLYRNISTIIATHHNFFAPVRSNDDLVFPDGYDTTSDAEQWTQNVAAFDNLLRNNDINIHELGGIGPRGLTGETGPAGTSIASVEVSRSATQTGIPTDLFPDGGTRYDVTVTLDDTPPTTISAGSFIARTGMQGIQGEQGPAGGTLETVTSDDGTITVTPRTDPVTGVPSVNLSVNGLGNATSIYERPLPTEPTTTDGNALILEYITATQTFEWVQVPSGIAVESSFIPGSTNPVESQLIQTGLAAKVDTDLSNITVNDMPIAGSTDLVRSGGVQAGLDMKQNTLPFTVPVEHDNDGFPTSDNISDTLDQVVFDTDIITTTTNEVTAIRTGGQISRNTDGTYSVIDNPLYPIVENTIRQGAVHIDAGDGIDIQLDSAGNDEISVLHDSTLSTDPTSRELAVTNPFTDEDETKLDAVDFDRPLLPWASGKDYVAGEQVIHDGGSNVNSIYIAARAVTSGRAAPSAQDNNDPDWYIVRSGLTAVGTDGTGGSGGVVSNTTLNINQGSGVSVTRSGTTFTIAQTGTHHGGDVDDFGPGYAYSYFNLVDDTNHSGIVGARHTGIQIDEVQTIGNDVYLHISFQDPNRFLPGERFAFRTTSGTRSGLFPNQADDVDRIVYAVQDADPELVIITQTDPGVNTLGDLATLFDVAGGNRAIILTFQDLFPLTDNHVTPAGGTADWAINNDPTAIPGNKFESLSETKPTEWADGTSTTGVTIDSSWLPTITTTLGGLDDVHITNPAVNNVIEYRVEDATATPPVPETGWYNVPMDMAQVNLNQETDTGSLTGNINDLVHITGGANNEINFLAFQLQGATASLTTGNLTRALYTGQTSAFFNYTFSNLSGALAVNISNQSGTGSAVPDTANNRVRVTGLDNSTVNTFSFTITILDGTTQLLQQNRSVSFTDQRSISYSPAPPGSFDISSGGSFTYGVAAGGGGTISSFERSLNGGTVGGVGTTSETITNQQMVDRFPNDFTIASVSSVYTNEPMVQSNTLGTRTVDLYRAFFFWDSTTDPTVATDFDGRRTQEFAAGVTGLTSGMTTSMYYLAFPWDLEDPAEGRSRFMFSAGGPLTGTVTIPADPTDEAATFITRNGINYIVYIFDDVLPSTTFTVTQ